MVAYIEIEIDTLECLILSGIFLDYEVHRAVQYGSMSMIAFPVIGNDIKFKARINDESVAVKFSGSKKEVTEALKKMEVYGYKTEGRVTHNDYSIIMEFK